METTTINVGRHSITLPARVALTLQRDHGTAVIAAGDLAAANAAAVSAEGRMASTLASLHAIARGSFKGAIDASEADLVSEWFGTEVPKGTASEWITASVAVVEWHAPESITQHGRKALVEWSRSASAACKAKTDELAAKGLPDRMAKVAARGEVRASLADASVVDADGGEVSAVRTIAKAIPGIEAIEGDGGRLVKAEGRKATRKAKAPVSADASPAPKGRAELVGDLAESAEAIRSMDLANGKASPDWGAVALALVAVLGHEDAGSMAKLIATKARASAKS